MMKIRITALDKKFSFFIRFIRDGGICQRCQAQFKHPTSGLHNSHFWGRGKHSTRFDQVNCAALCYGCHRHFTSHPDEHRAFFLKRLGEREYNLLALRANTPKKPDLTLLDIWLTKEIKDYQGYVIGAKA